MTARELIAADRLLVVAHRGNSCAAPENTLPAFESAVGLGVDLVELDYRHSADGVPVVFHDELLDRTTDAPLRWGTHNVSLQSTSLAQLRELDAGSWYGSQFANTRIPTLEEALDTIQSKSTAVLERKAGDAATLVELLRRKNLLDRVLVHAFDWSFLADCRRLAPNLALAALGQWELSPDKLGKIAELDVQAVGWDDRATTPDLIDAVHRRGWKAWVWTVDSLARSRELIAAGIDAITTNDPARLKQFLASRSAG